MLTQRGVICCRSSGVLRKRIRLISLSVVASYEAALDCTVKQADITLLTDHLRGCTID